MSKYKVEVGGFVSTYRKRTLTIHAENEEEASKKAIEKFIDFQQEKVGSMCDEGQVNSIEEI